MKLLLFISLNLNANTSELWNPLFGCYETLEYNGETLNTSQLATFNLKQDSWSIGSNEPSVNIDLYTTRNSGHTFHAFKNKGLFSKKDNEYLYIFQGNVFADFWMRGKEKTFVSEYARIQSLGSGLIIITSDITYIKRDRKFNRSGTWKLQKIDDSCF